MGAFCNLWVDNTTPIPENYSTEWTQARTMYEACIKIELIPFNKISISCKMCSIIGDSEITPHDLIKWITQRKEQQLQIPNIIELHNRQNMTQCRKLYREIMEVTNQDVPLISW